MNFWEKVKKDLKKGIKEGIEWQKLKEDLQKGIKGGMEVVKEGATIVKERAEELTEEGKRQYQIFTLKGRVQGWIAELGGKVYELSSKMKNPINNTTVQLIIKRINKLEAQITKIEEKPRLAKVQKKTKPVPIKAIPKQKAK